MSAIAARPQLEILPKHPKTTKAKRKAFSWYKYEPTHVPLLEFERMSTVEVATMGCDRLTD